MLMIQLITFCSGNGATKDPGFLQWDGVLFLLRTCKPRRSHGNVAVIKRRNRFQVASGELQQVLGHRVLFYFLHLRKRKDFFFFFFPLDQPLHVTLLKENNQRWGDVLKRSYCSSSKSCLFSFNSASKSVPLRFLINLFHRKNGSLSPAIHFPWWYTAPVLHICDVVGDFIRG